MEGNESHLETLAREIKEETGMALVPESVEEFGEVLKIQKGNENGENVIHTQRNFYYMCKVEDKMGTQRLEDDEKELDFVLRFVPVEEAIVVNSAFRDDNAFHKQMVAREKRVLEMIRSL